MGDGKDMRARPWRECISEVEAYDAAKEAHKSNGHFRRDLIKVALMDKFYSPWLDKSIVQAITSVAPAPANSWLTAASQLISSLAGDQLAGS